MKNNEINVHNPTALYHLVYLDQDTDKLNLHLSGDHLNCNVEYDDKFIRLLNKKTKDKILTQKFKINQEPFAYNYSSNFYIGDISVGNKGNLLLLAKSRNDQWRDFFTVMAPVQESIRIKPHHILEVVYFNTEDFTWAWKNDSDIFMKEVFPETKYQKGAVSKHFAFSDTIYYKLGTNQKCYYAGKFMFGPASHSANFLHVYVDLNDKYKQKIYDRSVIGQKKEIVRQTITTNPNVLVIRDVVFEKVKYDNLADGCKILNAVETSKENYEASKTETNN